jgi:hypothetical protein
VVNDLLRPLAACFDYQNFLLEEQLACKSPATYRLVQLIEGMLKVKAASGSGPLEFPARMLDDADLFVSSALPLSELRRYYPAFPIPADMELREMKLELAAARGTIQTLYKRVEHLERRLTSIPGYIMLRKLRKRLRRR